jgi:hypothetical protein
VIARRGFRFRPSRLGLGQEVGHVPSTGLVDATELSVVGSGKIGLPATRRILWTIHRERACRDCTSRSRKARF